MSQFNAPVRRSGGGLDVYTGLLFVALVVMVAGVSWMIVKNSDHSAAGSGGSGGPFKLVDR
jgi:hypothetical protein